MRLMGFISSLLKFLKKDILIEDIDTSLKELNQTVVPLVVQFAEQTEYTNLHSAKSKNVQTQFKKFFVSPSGSKKPSMIGEIARVISNVKSNLEIVKENSELLLNGDVIREGLTAKKAVLVRAAEHISFISRFTLDLIEYICEMELEAAKSGKESDLPPVKIRRVESMIQDYAALLSVYCVDPKDFLKNLEAIPETIINDKTAPSLISVYGEKVLDPFASVTSKNFSGSPIYHIGLMWAEWQSFRYKVAEEKKRMLELRIIELRQRQSGNNDPKLEMEIEYIKNRIEGYERQMQELED